MYGAIPTSSSPAPDQYISGAKERLRSNLASRRPWRELLAVRSLSLPPSFRDALSRARFNIAYFRMNYAMIVLLILFLSLLWHPVSLIVFVIMMAAWLFLYFLRDQPLALFNRSIDDRIVLITLSILTVVFLLLTHATVNILVSVLIGVVVVLVHAAWRRTDDLFHGEEEAGMRGLMSPREPDGASSASSV